MPIDNRDKRASAAFPLLPWMRIELPFPDNDLDEGDRAQLGGVYRDIDFDETPSGGMGMGGRAFILKIID